MTQQPNALHPTCYSGLRPLSQAGELERYEYHRKMNPPKTAIFDSISISRQLMQIL